MNPDIRDIILEELRRHGEHAPRQALCRRCRSGVQRHRCRDCFWAQPMCAACVVAEHGSHPLHRIQTWSGGIWVPETLKNLGLRISLGHGPGGRCTSPFPRDSFIVIDRNGIQEVAIDFCGCGQGGPRGRQF
ncbi:hypothetical protein B0H17DRAFT_466089 [Mycena rosella]|uniref:CxC2-like cysteine cluster KDZ transposase-associated domain-containing protein n=1 Tax=Mycena rosella TaxID=1033263 RepID=A0AAD7DPE3_MYCRO|nr:hypothetical protein B0H17DRAFT_466089 [Mycena rosella]